MKTFTFTLLVTLALSLVLGRPHTPEPSGYTQLSTRSLSDFHGRSHHHRSISSKATRSHPKRGSSQYDELKYREAHKRADASEKYDGSSHEDDECTDSSDSSDDEGQYKNDPSDHTPYKVGHRTPVTAMPGRSVSTYSDPSDNQSSPEKPSKPQISANLIQPSDLKHASQTLTSHQSNDHLSKAEKHHDSKDGESLSSYVSSHKQLHKPSYGSSYGGYHGKATFFSQDGNPGACGKTYQDSDFIVAIQSLMYDGGKFCGKTIVVTRKSTGRSIICTGADECPGCPTNQSLDLSKAAFNALGDPDEGVFDISWKVLD